MTIIGSRKEEPFGSRIKFNSGVVLVRSENAAEADNLQISEEDIAGVQFFLSDIFGHVPLYLIPEATVLSVLHELGKGEPKKMTKPLALDRKLSLSLLENNPVNLLS